MSFWNQQLCAWHHLLCHSLVRQKLWAAARCFCVHITPAYFKFRSIFLKADRAKQLLMIIVYRHVRQAARLLAFFCLVLQAMQVFRRLQQVGVHRKIVQSTQIAQV